MRDFRHFTSRSSLTATVINLALNASHTKSVTKLPVLINDIFNRLRLETLMYFATLK